MRQRSTYRRMFATRLRQTSVLAAVGFFWAVTTVSAQEQTINENAPATHGAGALSSAAPTVSAASYGNLMKALARLKPAGGTGPGATSAMVGEGLGAMPLHHLPPHPLGTRLAGESDSRTWPFYAGARNHTFYRNKRINNWH